MSHADDPSRRTHADPGQTKNGESREVYLTPFRRAGATACGRAGVTGMLRHDRRRTAVRNMEQAAEPRSVAMKLAGHKTENVYRRYAIVSPADL